VEPVCGINLSLPKRGPWKRSAELAIRLLSKSDTGLVHRDLQSQNVIIHERTPVLIDFRAADGIALL
jgi:aminoglycoside/choline kinase family phosphotransferase